MMLKSLVIILYHYLDMYYDIQPQSMKAIIIKGKSNNNIN